MKANYRALTSLRFFAAIATVPARSKASTCSRSLQKI
jgi:hypothetical protein